MSHFPHLSCLFFCGTNSQNVEHTQTDCTVYLAKVKPKTRVVFCFYATDSSIKLINCPRYWHYKHPQKVHGQWETKIHCGTCSAQILGVCCENETWKSTSVQLPCKIGVQLCVATHTCRFCIFLSLLFFLPVLARHKANVVSLSLFLFFFLAVTVFSMPWGVTAVKDIVLRRLHVASPLKTLRVVITNSISVNYVYNTSYRKCALSQLGYYVQPQLAEHC